MEKLITFVSNLGSVEMAGGDVVVVADEWRNTSGGVNWWVTWGKRRASEAQGGSGTGELVQEQPEAGAEDQNGPVPFVVPLQLLPGQMLVPVGHFSVLVQQPVVLAVLAPLQGIGPLPQGGGVDAGVGGQNEKGAG